MTRGEVLFIGGCAGVGKSSVAAEIHAQLAAARVRHCIVEGDNLDLAWPMPSDRGLRLAEVNLRSMWAAYREAGYARMVYTNTACVLPEVMTSLVEAFDEDVVVHAVLLQAEKETVADRLRRRETGSGFDWHVTRSRRLASLLEANASGWIPRIVTDGQSVAATAAAICSMLVWAPLPEDQ